MGLLDSIRNLISRQKPLQIPASTRLNGNETIDKTMPFITIDAINALINDPSVFNKFMDFDKNQEFFKGLTPDFIAKAVKDYVDFMHDKGLRFDRKAQKHINKIKSFLPKEEKDKTPVFRQYKGVNKTNLYNMAISIVGSNDMLQQFLNCQRTGQEFDGIPQNVLADYISTELFDFTRKIVPSIQIEKNIAFIRTKGNMIQDSYRVNPDYRINPDFERSVMDAIKPTNDPAEFAFQLYNELNKRVKYNPAFFALDQDLTDQFAHDIYYQEFGKVSPENNSLICKQWSELYAYFLEKNGFEAHVCGKGKHKFVRAFYGTNVIEADATNQTTSVDDPSRLTDLTRSKLGVRPAGFKAYDYFQDKKTGRDMATVRLNYDIADFSQNRGANDQLIEIINMIDDKRDLTSLIMGLNDPRSEVGSIMKKLGFISDMLKGSNLDNMDSVGYLNHLFHNTIKAEEFNRIHLTNAFYRNIYTNDCDMVPIISVNQAKDTRNTSIDDFLYFEFDQQSHEIRPISREKLVEQVVTGELIQGRGKEDKVRVPGIPELTDPNYISQKRALLARRSQEQELYNATTRTAKAVYPDIQKSDWGTDPLPTVDDESR